MRPRVQERRRGPSAAALLLGAGLFGSLTGCVVQSSEEPLPFEPSQTAFAETIDQVLEKRCGASNCHGAERRPFALYAGLQRRMPPTPTFDKSSLDEEEVLSNYRATLGFLDHEESTETTLIQKALGALGHGGGFVFEHRSDPECRAIRAWIGGPP